jgi:hypothetical protein
MVLELSVPVCVSMAAALGDIPLEVSFHLEQKSSRIGGRLRPCEK